MTDPITLFVAGLGGVFAGMALLYLAIRVTAVVTDRVVARVESREAALVQESENRAEGKSKRKSEEKECKDG